MTFEKKCPPECQASVRHRESRRNPSRVAPKLAHRVGHDCFRKHNAQFGAVADQLRMQIGVGSGAHRERDVIPQFVYLIVLRRCKRGLGVTKAPGDYIRIGAHHSLDGGTERLGPGRRWPDRPRYASDDDCNQSNKSDAAHTHDGIDMVSIRMGPPLWPLLAFAPAARRIPLLIDNEIFFVPIASKTSWDYS